MTFRVGQRVVCVDDATVGLGIWRDDEKIYEGQIYTVRSVHLDDGGNLVLWLDEVRRCVDAINDWGPRCGYGVWRFRPLTKNKTDTGVAILKKIASDLSKQLERVER